MTRGWMPFYVGDFLADTLHLGAAEIGMYALLIMHCWQHGSIPRDDRKLARIAHCDSRLWHRYRETMLRFFDIVDGSTMQHRRVSKELLRYKELSNKRKEAGQQKQKKKRAKTEQLHTPPPPPLSSVFPKEGNTAEAAPDTATPVGEDPRAKLFREGKTILISFGVREERTGGLIGRWLKTCADDVIGLLAVIEYARNQSVADPVAYISASLSNRNKPDGRVRGSELAFQMAAEIRERELASNITRSPDFVGSG